jgi:hypothetical protein
MGYPVQNGSGAHPASYPMGTRGSFPGGKAADAWSIPLLPQYAFTAWCSVKKCSGTTLLLWNGATECIIRIQTMNSIYWKQSKLYTYFKDTGILHINLQIKYPCFRLPVPTIFFHKKETGLTSSPCCLCVPPFNFWIKWQIFKKKYGTNVVPLEVTPTL